MATNKTALDQQAKSYWEEYFGDYGKLWVRDIPRNVKSAMLDDRKKTAGPETQITESEVVPVGYAVKADRVVLEGVHRGTFSDGHREAKLFSIEFDHEGKVLNVKARKAPAS